MITLILHIKYRQQEELLIKTYHFCFLLKWEKRGDLCTCYIIQIGFQASQSKSIHFICTLSLQLLLPTQLHPADSLLWLDTFVFHMAHKKVHRTMLAELVDTDFVAWSLVAFPRNFLFRHTTADQAVWPPASHGPGGSIGMQLCQTRSHQSHSNSKRPRWCLLQWGNQNTWVMMFVAQIFF